MYYGLINSMKRGVALSTLNNNLVNSWNANGNANDSTGSINGTLTNGATASGTSKVGSNSLSLDGVDDFVSFTQGTMQYTDISFACWIKSNDVTSLKAVASNFSIPGNFYGWFLLIEGGKLKIRLYDGTTSSATLELISSTTLSINTWYHVAFTRDSTGTHLYINGSVENSDLTNKLISYSSNLPRIGTLSTALGTNYFYFNGLIDAIQVWNAKKTTTEMVELYNSGTGKEPPF